MVARGWRATELCRNTMIITVGDTRTPAKKVTQDLLMYLKYDINHLSARK